MPKGHIEQGETEERAAKREVKEETGLNDVEFVEGFREEIHYWFKFQGKTISKTVVFYLGQTHEETITISSEHLGYEWLPCEEALEKLTFQNARDVLKKAHGFVSPR